MWDDETGHPIFRATMSQQDFELITSCLRFDDKNTREERRLRDKMAPIRTIIDIWTASLKKNYTPGNNITVDEQLIRYRGSCPFRQYIPSKPGRYGIKVWAACDSSTSYAWNIQIYTGKAPNCKTELNQGKRVVLEITEGLPYRNITTDNFFTSHSLACELKQRHQTIIGTVRKNKTFLPPQITNVKGMPVFSSNFFFDNKNKVMLCNYIPKKNKVVVMLSTKHFKTQISDAIKNKPEIILDYNKTKSGVDTCDQMMGTFTVKRGTRRWPMAIFSYILDISGINSFIIYNDIKRLEKGEMKRRTFLKNVAKSLVNPYITKRERMPRTRNAREIVRKIQENRVTPASNKRKVQNDKQIPKKRARCAICPYSANGNKYNNVCCICKKSFCKEHGTHYMLCNNCE